MTLLRSKPTLDAQLSGLLLASSMAGCFFITVAALTADRWSVGVDLLWLALCAALAVSLLGSMAVRRTSRWHALIERQLSLFAGRSAGHRGDLQPLPTAHPLPSAWNKLLRTLQSQEAWDGVERRLTAAVCEQQSRRWKAVFESLSDGLAVCDSDGRIQQANGALAALLGMESSAVLVGLSFQEQLVEKLGARSQTQFEQALTSPASTVVELRGGEETSNGVWRLSRTFQSAGETDGVATVWMVRDVTQQKLAEESREQFVSMAAHELRTPLANIRAYAETLSMSDQIGAEEQKGFYNIISDEACRLSRFIDELLNVSQMEAGAVTIRKSEVWPERLLEQVLESQRPLAVEKRQVLEVKLSPQLPAIQADKEKLAAAMTNLVGNAIKYTPPEGRISVRVHADQGRFVMEVEDDGIGIAPEDQQRLGTKFFRSGDRRVQAANGSGLGLAFTREVARLHGGELLITSQLDQGSCFTLELPIG